MTDEMTTETKVELLMILYGYSLEEAQRLAADPDVEVIDVIVDGEPFAGKSIFDTDTP